jgi:hypothetical protein
VTNERLQEASSKNGTDIQALIERGAKVVREENRAGIRADNDSEMLMLDVRSGPERCHL